MNIIIQHIVNPAVRAKQLSINENGFTLIELIVFITVVGIAAGILFPVLLSLKYAGTLPSQTISQQLARARLELILENRYLQGFSNFTDPCAGGSPPAVCTPPTDYSVSATITNNWSGDTNYKIITVSVTGAAQTTLTNLVAYYE